MNGTPDTCMCILFDGRHSSRRRWSLSPPSATTATSGLRSPSTAMRSPLELKDSVSCLIIHFYSLTTEDVLFHSANELTNYCLILFLFVMYVACGSNTGSGFVFHRTSSQESAPSSLNFTWVLNSSFQAPSGADGHYGHVTVINENLASFGAFGHGKK